MSLVMPKEYISVTTQLGCPCACMKYCPQEILVKRYTSPIKTLTLENFERMLKNIPKDLPVVFSGFCEPFANPNVVELIEASVRSGHKIGLLTTLYGATRSQVDRILELKPSWVCLHIPDGETLDIPVSQEYKDNFFKVVTTIRNLSTMQMNDTFKTNNRENVTRGIKPAPKQIGICTDDNIEHPHPILMPNGDVYFCCMDMKLEHKVGNLFEENWAIIRKRIREGRFGLCQFCSWNRPRVYEFYDRLAMMPRRSVQRLRKTLR